MDGDTSRCIWGGVIFVVLTLIAMFFSAGEVAVVSFSESKLKRLADAENKKAAALYRLKERQFDFSMWASTSALFCMLGAVGVAIYGWSPLLGEWLAAELGWLHGSYALSAVLIFLLSAFLVLTLGQALPKKLVSYRPEAFALAAIGPLRALGAVFRPVTWLVMKTARMIVRLAGYDPDAEYAGVTEEEIRMLVDAGNEKGTIEYSERQMINNIFEFDDRTVGEVMTHRTDITAAEKDDPLSSVLTLAINRGFSRIPVYEEDIDNIVGIFYVKDLLELIGNPEAANKTIGDYMRPVIYVPESTRCRVLFRRFKESKVHMAVIVDEYGGTAGIVTMEDLLEFIVGNIQDEYDQEIDEVQKLEDNLYSLDGGVLIDHVEELLGVDLDADEDTDTIGGLIANTLGRIPTDGEITSVVIKNIEFTVMVVEDRRIVRVRARKLPDTAGA